MTHFVATCNWTLGVRTSDITLPINQTYIRITHDMILASNAHLACM